MITKHSRAPEANHSSVDHIDTFPIARLLIIGFCTFILFLLLRSSNYTAVDGGMRSLQIFNDPQIHFHGNNHLLYPFYVYCWHQSLLAFGLKASGPFQFLAWTQAMNALAASAVVVLVCWIIYKLNSSFWVSIVGAATLAFSRAFLLHATNAAEPMIGLLWSAVAGALLINSTLSRHLFHGFLSGIFLSLAMASYQSMIFIAPLLTVIAFFAVEKRTQRIVLVWSGFIIGVLAIYGTVYWVSGSQTILSMIERFMTFHGEKQVFGGFTISKFTNLFPGLVGNLLYAYPSGYSGIRNFLNRSGFPFFWGCLTTILCMIFFVSFFLVLKKFQILNSLSRVKEILLASLFLLIPLAYWSPTYDKLWLQPLACLIVMIALCLPLLRVREKRNHCILLVLCFLIVVSNLSWAIPDATNPVPFQREAEAIDRIVSPNDLLVYDWDPVSQLYVSTYGSKKRNYDFPSRGAQLQSGLTKNLEETIRSTQKRNGKIYFLGILDETPSSWGDFLWKNVKIPYETLDIYRKNTVILNSFPTEHATVTLRILTTE